LAATVITISRKIQRIIQTGSKLAPRRAVLKFDLDAIHRSTMETMAHHLTISVDVRFFL
jgi:hypothetical protein